MITPSPLPPLPGPIEEPLPETHGGAEPVAEDAFARAYVVGDVIGNKYELRRKLAQGGMGAVWVALNRMLRSEVALKLVRPGLAGDAAAERLLREARAAAALHHPAVVQVFDFGVTERGDPFLVMELLEGETLAVALGRERRFTGERAVQLILPVLDGLAAVHARGVVHRDLKPDNIVFSRDDTGGIRPKVVDFGIAKVSAQTLSAADRKLTRVGTVLGSPEYMSPEQARGVVEIDARTDIWSMGVVLFEMLSGDVPFSASNYHALLLSIVEKPVPELQGVDPDLAAIVGRALCKDRDARWPSMRALGLALAQWLVARGVAEDITSSSLRATWMASSPSIAESPPAPAAFVAVSRSAMTLVEVDEDSLQAVSADTPSSEQRPSSSLLLGQAPTAPFETLEPGASRPFRSTAEGAASELGPRPDSRPADSVPPASVGARKRWAAAGFGLVAAAMAAVAILRSPVDHAHAASAVEAVQEAPHAADSAPKGEEIAVMGASTGESPSPTVDVVPASDSAAKPTRDEVSSAEPRPMINPTPSARRSNPPPAQSASSAPAAQLAPSASAAKAAVVKVPHRQVNFGF